MSLIVAGTVRVPSEELGSLRPHMIRMLTASRLEDGCAIYSYGEDVADPGLIRVFEVWRDRAALDAHFASAHMAEWRKACAEHRVSDRRLFAYEAAAEQSL
jgi:quinol monooxygenase YgiN